MYMRFDVLYVTIRMFIINYNTKVEITLCFDVTFNTVKMSIIEPIY
ncbi:hypothetical protein M2254_002877 [Chryseobacterium sp. BIGb0186]|nr:hypothetical protein [Chryseobacterium sp. JUb44]MDH6211293.1 hypothetical protein [Chryseobacterium sp. BIGb0186]